MSQVVPGLAKTSRDVLAVLGLLGKYVAVPDMYPVGGTACWNLDIN